MKIDTRVNTGTVVSILEGMDALRMNLTFLSDDQIDYLSRMVVDQKRDEIFSVGNINKLKEERMSAIVLNELKMPRNVEMVQTKSAIKFVRGEKKAYLKGSNLELTNPIRELGKRVREYSDAVIEKCHLGSVQACIPGVADTVDLQKILNKYFKSK